MPRYDKAKLMERVAGFANCPNAACSYTQIQIHRHTQREVPNLSTLTQEHPLTDSLTLASLFVSFFLQSPRFSKTTTCCPRRAISNATMHPASPAPATTIGRPSAILRHTVCFRTDDCRRGPHFLRGDPQRVRVAVYSALVYSL